MKNKKLFIEDLPILEGEEVRLRLDLNVPLKDGQVENDKRLRASLKTIEYLLNKKARLVLLSHLGRPKGRPQKEFSLAPVAKRLSELLGRPIDFFPECVGKEVDERVEGVAAGEAILLENVRFHAEETKNEESFAKALAGNARCFVNDAFGTAHRAHASTVGITKFVEKSACGYLIKKELDFLGAALQAPKRPFVVISGGAKISDKIQMIRAMLPKVDKILIGGGMAYTFLAAKGLEVGKSLLEKEKIDLAKELLKEAEGKLVLPIDSLAAKTVDFSARKVGDLRATDSEDMDKDEIGLDVGPKTIEHFSEILLSAKTIVWNGPMGVFEIPKAANGTFAIADALAKATKNGATTIIGGGDSAAAIEKAGLENKVSHISTGGGASLEFLEGKPLPGVEALSDA